MPAPLAVFPIVTQSRFQPNPPTVTVAGVVGKERNRQQGHVGDRVLKAAGDERVQAPEDRDALRGIVGHPRRCPDREANEPVAQHRAGHELDGRSVHLGGGDADDQWALGGQRQAAVGYEDRRKHDAACEIAGPGSRPARGKIPQDGPSPQPAETHEHRVAGKQVRTGEDDQRQSNAERGAHNNWGNARIDIRPDAENQDDPEPDIGSRHHRADPKGRAASAAGTRPWQSLSWRIDRRSRGTFDSPVQ